MASAQPMAQPPHRGAPPANSAQQAVSPPSKEQLKSWWTKFGRKKGKPEEQVPPNPGIFGVPLSDSILYANVAISLTNDNGESFIYGYVPIVVAKCGVFLKEKATDVEGIFRLSGSAKRIKDLQTIFNSPERYGKGLDWTGYTVHDAANILRRYLNQLPEPIVPLQYYEQFRDPLRAYQAKVGNAAQAQSMENQEHARAVVAYQKLITQLPALNRQLLLYILDLLAVFASKSDLNRMTAQNLAAIFQPGIISHPHHDMAPNEYRLSQDVLIFLIENQDNFLIGMSGTAMDEKTKDEVKSGPPSIKTPKTTIGRSASTASAGADSIRRTAGVRRNGSVSSRTSRDKATGSPGVSSPGTPVSPSAASGSAGTPSGGGLARSNTVPSNRSPGLAGPRFQRMSEANALSSQNINAPIPYLGPQGGGAGDDAEVITSESNIAAGAGTGAPSSPVSPTQQRAIPVLANSTAQQEETTGVTGASDHVANETGPQTEVPTSTPASDLRPAQESSAPGSVSSKPAGRDRKISNLLSISPMFGPSDQSRDPNQRQPRKLQKRRIPGSHNESAQSSQASLTAEDALLNQTPLTPNNINQDRPNPLDLNSTSVSHATATPNAEPSPMTVNTTSPTTREARATSRTLMPPHSPTPSAHSRGSATDPSDLDALEDPAVREERRRQATRSSLTRNESPLAPPPALGQLPGARNSNSSLGSNRPRKSFTGDSQLTQTSVADATSSVGQPSFTNISSRESTEMLKEHQTEPEKKGLFGRFRAKINQTREQYEAERERAKSPPRMQGDHASSRGSLSAAFSHDRMGGRDRSFDRSREESLTGSQPRNQAQRFDEPPNPIQSPIVTQIQPPTPVPNSTTVPAHATESNPIHKPTSVSAAPPYGQLAGAQTFPMSAAAPVSAMGGPSMTAPHDLVTDSKVLASPQPNTYQQSEGRDEPVVSSNDDTSKNVSAPAAVSTQAELTTRNPEEAKTQPHPVESIADIRMGPKTDHPNQQVPQQ